MTIENSEKLYLVLWLLLAVRLNSRFLEIQDNTDSILIVISYKTIMSVGTICDHVWKKRTL